MITFIYDTNDKLITNLVNTAILTPSIVKVKHRLLDGTYHRQNIGQHINNIDVICYVDEAGKTKLDNMYVIDEPIKLIRYNKFYIGLMDEISWEVFTKGGLYQGQFQLIVSGEGSI